MSSSRRASLPPLSMSANRGISPPTAAILRMHASASWRRAAFPRPESPTSRGSKPSTAPPTTPVSGPTRPSTSPVSASASSAPALPPSSQSRSSRSRRSTSPSSSAHRTSLCPRTTSRSRRKIQSTTRRTTRRTSTGRKQSRVSSWHPIQTGSVRPRSRAKRAWRAIRDRLAAGRLPPPPVVHRPPRHHRRQRRALRIRARKDPPGGEGPRSPQTLCPRDHPLGTKRICIDSSYYETYNRDNVTLVDPRKTRSKITSNRHPRPRTRPTISMPSFSRPASMR